MLKIFSSFGFGLMGILVREVFMWQASVMQAIKNFQHISESVIFILQMRKLRQWDVMSVLKGALELAPVSDKSTFPHTAYTLSKTMWWNMKSGSAPSMVMASNALDLFTLSQCPHFQWWLSMLVANKTGINIICWSLNTHSEDTLSDTL